LSQVRDSSFIAQESDKVIFIKRHGRKVEDRMEFDNNNSVYVLKNRKNGKLGTIPFYYNFEEGMLNEGSATA
jgi:replicative DNA helicase